MWNTNLLSLTLSQLSVGVWVCVLHADLQVSINSWSEQYVLTFCQKTKPAGLSPIPLLLDHKGPHPYVHICPVPASCLDVGRNKIGTVPQPWAMMDRFPSNQYLLRLSRDLSVGQSDVVPAHHMILCFAVRRFSLSLSLSPAPSSYWQFLPSVGVGHKSAV